MAHDIKSPLSLSSLSIDPFVMSSRSQEADIGSSPSRSSSKTVTSTTKTASIVVKKEMMAYVTPPAQFITVREVKDVGGLPEMTNQLRFNHVHPAMSQSRVIPTHREVRTNYRSGVFFFFFWVNLRKDQLITASNTPMKSKPLISTNSFGPVVHYDPLDHELVWLTVSDVVSMTEEYRNRGTESR